MVKTTPHGEGNVRDHINTEYDNDKDGNIENANVDALLNLAASDAFSAYPLTSADIATGAITSGEIADDTITATDVALNTLTASEIASGAVDTTELAANAATPSEIDGSGGSNGDVLTTDGTANGVSWLASSGGSLQWTHLGSFGNNQSSSVSFSLTSQWDEVSIHITSDTSGTSGTALDLRVNGITSGYESYQINGNTTSDGFVKHILTSGFAHGGVINIDGTWANSACIGRKRGIDTQATNPVALKESQCVDVAGGGSLDSFEIFDDASNNFTIQGEVYGRNVP